MILKLETVNVRMTTLWEQIVINAQIQEPFLTALLVSIIKIGTILLSADWLGLQA